MLMTPLTCSSWHALTHRSQLIQRLGSNENPGWVVSMGCSVCIAPVRAAEGSISYSSSHIDNSSVEVLMVSLPSRFDSTANNSRTVFRDRSTRSLFVWMTIPSLTKRLQLGASARSPLISTTQARQLPSGLDPSLWHRVGSDMPSFLVASSIDVVGETSRERSSIVIATEFLERVSVMVFDLCRKIVADAIDDVWRRLSKSTD